MRPLKPRWRRSVAVLEQHTHTQFVMVGQQSARQPNTIDRHACDGRSQPRARSTEMF